MTKRYLAMLPLVATLAGCMVGPNYKGPPEVAPASTAAGEFHRAPADVVDAAAPPAQWWLALNDPELTHLVDLAFSASPTLDVAEARIREARASLTQQKTQLLPQGSATGLAIRARLPTGQLSTIGNSIGPVLGGTTGGTALPSTTDLPDHYTTDLYSVGFDASWAIDLFGGVRRGVEQARARAQAAVINYQDSQVQLAAEIGQAYVNLRDVQHRLDLTRRSSALEHRMLDLTSSRRQLGTADDSDIERLRAQISQTEANRPVLASQVDQYMDQLAMLTGREPGALDSELTSVTPLPLPPAEVPVGDPAGVLRRRPDIRSAERQIAASNAAIGQAVAQLFPQVTLFGTLGFGASSVSNLFQGNSLSAIGGPSLSWNILNFGRTQAQIRQARASDDESIAQYRSTVLSALQDAERSVSRFGGQRENVVELGRANLSATRSAEIVSLRYRGGTASALDALDAERQRLQAEQSLAQAQAQLTNDYVSLQMSLGLGWQDAPIAVAAITRTASR